MAIKLKATKSYTDQFSSTSSTTYYGVVDECNGNKNQKVQTFMLQIYKNSTARSNGKLPLESYFYQANGADFDTYFGITPLATDDQYAKAYDYILTEVKNPDETLTWADWETDEV